MNFHILLLALLVSSILAFSHVHHNGYGGSIHHRFRRVPSGRHCGPRLARFVFHVCEESCQPGSNVDLSEECCKKQCDFDAIKKYCCPNKI